MAGILVASFMQPFFFLCFPFFALFSTPLVTFVSLLDTSSIIRLKIHDFSRPFSLEVGGRPLVTTTTLLDASRRPPLSSRPPTFFSSNEVNRATLDAPRRPQNTKETSPKDSPGDASSHSIRLPTYAHAHAPLSACSAASLPLSPPLSPAPPPPRTAAGDGHTKKRGTFLPYIAPLPSLPNDWPGLTKHRGSDICASSVTSRLDCAVGFVLQKVLLRPARHRRLAVGDSDRGRQDRQHARPARRPPLRRPSPRNHHPSRRLPDGQARRRTLRTHHGRRQQRSGRWPIRRPWHWCKQPNPSSSWVLCSL